MTFRDRAQPEASGFQIAPMIDIVFLLLIFFLVTWNFARDEMELDVQVPTAKEGKENRRAMGEVILNVREDGSIVMNRRTMTETELEEALVRIAELYPDQAVVLRADTNAPYRFVVSVLDICQRAKIWNVAFATSRPE
jgi:Biopolymer transport protein